MVFDNRILQNSPKSQPHILTSSTYNPNLSPAGPAYREASARRPGCRRGRSRRGRSLRDIAQLRWSTLRYGVSTRSRSSSLASARNARFPVPRVPAGRSREDDQTYRGAGRLRAEAGSDRGAGRGGATPDGHFRADLLWLEEARQRARHGHDAPAEAARGREPNVQAGRRRSEPRSRISCRTGSQNQF